MWGPEEYFSKGNEESLKIGCRDTLKSVFTEIPRTNSSAASQGGRWRDLWLQSSHSPGQPLCWGSCLSHSQFQPPVLGLKLVLPQSEREQKPQGQVWVVAERESKPRGTRVRCFLLLVRSPSSTKSGQEMAAEGGLGMGSTTSPDPSF